MVIKSKASYLFAALHLIFGHGHWTTSVAR